MSRLRLTSDQRAAILRAAADARQRGPVGFVQQNGRQVMAYDAVHLAVDTGNYWWQGGLDNRACEAALRLVHMSLRLGPRS